MSGLDPRQLLEIAVRPALEIMGDEFGGTNAEQLLMGTAAVESGLVHLRQLPNGPALGLWQMEPATFYDLAQRYRQWKTMVTSPQPSAEQVAWNLRLGAAMARLKYRDAPAALPAAWDIEAMESYHKRYYNSMLGATKPGEFRSAWNRLIAPQAERMWPRD